MASASPHLRILPRTPLDQLPVPSAIGEPERAYELAFDVIPAALLRLRIPEQVGDSNAEARARTNLGAAMTELRRHVPTLSQLEDRL